MFDVCFINPFDLILLLLDCAVEHTEINASNGFELESEERPFPLSRY